MSSAPSPPSVLALLRIVWEDAIPEVHDGLTAAGFDDIRPSHRNLLRHVLTGELRPSELAARLGMSKQAANDVLREFEAGGYITLVPDPEDGRAKRIQATERGMALTKTASEISGQIVRRWADRVGDRRFARFEEILRELADGDGDRVRDARNGTRRTTETAP